MVPLTLQPQHLDPHLDHSNDNAASDKHNDNPGNVAHLAAMLVVVHHAHEVREHLAPLV